MDVTRQEFDELRAKVEAMGERLSQGDITLALLKQRLDGIEAGIVEIKAAVTSIKEKPGRRWESLVEQILSWATLAVLGYIAGKVGGLL